MKKGEKNEKNYIGKSIMHYMKYKCFYRNKTECTKHFPNVRFHNADFRFSAKCKDVYEIDFMARILSYLDYLLNENDITFEKIKIEINDIKSNKDYYRLSQEFSTYNGFATKIVNSLKCKKMYDQIRKCDKTIQSKIMKYIKDYMINMKKMYQYIYNDKMSKLIDNMTNLDKWYSIADVAETVSILYVIVISMRCIIMDIYTISRIMKKLKNDNYENNIVYTGQTHTNNYYNFFKNYLKFNVEFIGIPDRKRCIDISNMSFL